MPVHRRASALITRFGEARDHAGRADALLRLPVRFLAKYRDHLIHGCDMSGFQVGADYVAAMTEAIAAERGADGEFPEHLRAIIDRTGEALRVMAAGEREAP